MVNNALKQALELSPSVDVAPLVGERVVDDATLKIQKEGRWRSSNVFRVGTVLLAGAMTLAGGKNDCRASQNPRIVPAPPEDNGSKKSAIEHVRVPDGFIVEQVASPALTGHVLCMEYGDEGLMIGGVESIALLRDEDGDGTFETKRMLTSAIKNCQGILAYDATTFFCSGIGPKGTGLYRLQFREGEGGGAEPQCTLVLGASQGAKSGEHGPHAINRGPDGYLYWMTGNESNVAAPPTSRSLVLHQEIGDVLRPGERGEGVMGGAVWRIDPATGECLLLTAGLRNAYDFILDEQGDIVAFDSDNESEEHAPHFRRVCVDHCVPGADFGRRGYTSDQPPYFADTLPGILDIHRGSPCGMVRYEHTRFPEKYRDAIFLADWSYGRIFAVRLKRSGATFAVEWIEEFATGTPLPVTDLVVGPDGDLFYSTGGREAEGGVCRIRSAKATSPASPRTPDPTGNAAVEVALSQPQPHASFGRAAVSRLRAAAGEHWATELNRIARDENKPKETRLRALSFLTQHGPEPDTSLARSLLADTHPELRGMAAVLLSCRASRNDVKEDLMRLLADREPLVQRRALEASLLAGVHVPLGKLRPLLASEDRFVRYAARLALERLDPAEWQETILRDDHPRVNIVGIIALNRLGVLENDPARKGKEVFDKMLEFLQEEMSPEDNLDILRCLELTLIHVPPGERPPSLHRIGELLLARFPSGRSPEDRELARLFAAMQLPGALECIITVMTSHKGATAESRSDAMHFAFCASQFPSQYWTETQRRMFAHWFDVVAPWEGKDFRDGLLDQMLRGLSKEEVGALLQTPHAHRRVTQKLLEETKGFAPGEVSTSLAIFQGILQPQKNDVLQWEIPRLQELAIEELLAREQETITELRIAAIDGLGRIDHHGSEDALRTMYDALQKKIDDLVRAFRIFPNTPNHETLLHVHRKLVRERERIVQSLSQFPNAANHPIFLQALGSRDPVTRRAALQALSGKKGETILSREAHVTAEKVSDQSAQDKQYVSILKFLESYSSGSPERGRELFKTLPCAQCHKCREIGEGPAPDLSTLGSRLGRAATLEAIQFPSSVVPDRYRSVLIVTKDGRSFTGMKFDETGVSFRLQIADGRKLFFLHSEIEEMRERATSPMPEELLKNLTMEDIADLIAFLRRGNEQ